MKSWTGLALVLVAAVSTLPAQAGMLPDTAPIPAAKPSLLEPVELDRAVFEPIAISTTPKPIPEARLNVRVVGSKFLPPANEDIDFYNAEPRNEIEALARSIERFLAMTANRAMDDTEVEAPQQTAAIQNERVRMVIGSAE